MKLFSLENSGWYLSMFIVLLLGFNILGIGIQYGMKFQITWFLISVFMFSVISELITIRYYIIKSNSKILK